MNHYEEKQEARRQRLEDRADKASTEANRRFDSARQRLDQIPLGQPILVGHYSEKRHRKALERSDTDMRKGCEASDKAERLAYRAAAVGTGGISADDPEAVRKLDDKRSDLERLRDGMKAFNKAWKAAGSPKEENLDPWNTLREAFPSLAEKALSNMRFSWQKVPFPGYSLTNIGARIRAASVRVGNLEAEDEAPSIEGPEGDGWQLFDDERGNRVGFYFDGKPAEAIRSQCKRAGLKWSPTEGRWQRQRNNAGRHAVRDLAWKLATA